MELVSGGLLKGGERGFLTLKGAVQNAHMSYSLSSLRILYRGLYRELLQGVIEGDTRSLEYALYSVGACTQIRGLGAQTATIGIVFGIYTP